MIIVYRWKDASPSATLQHGHEPRLVGTSSGGVNPRIGDWSFCRNRHYPKCQGGATPAWLTERETDR
jgi:hypothetical protein